jgi:hypothetical protein
MNILESSIRPFEPLGIPKLNFSDERDMNWLVEYIKERIANVFEELIDLVDADIEISDPPTDHLRESPDGKQHFYQHQLCRLMSEAAYHSGADWAEGWVEMTPNRERMYAVYKVEFLIPHDEKVYKIQIAKSWDI